MWPAIREGHRIKMSDVVRKIRLISVCHRVAYNSVTERTIWTGLVTVQHHMSSHASDSDASMSTQPLYLETMSVAPRVFMIDDFLSTDEGSSNCALFLSCGAWICALTYLSRSLHSGCHHPIRTA